jgi:hypothetical protein
LVRVPIQTRGAVTVVVSLSELLAGLGSFSEAETLAEDERTVAAIPGITRTAMSEAAPTGRFGRVQVTMRFARLHVQPEPEALPKVTPEGSVWETDRDPAASGPSFATLIVYVNGEVPGTGSAESERANERSASARTGAEDCHTPAVVVPAYTIAGFVEPMTRALTLRPGRPLLTAVHVPPESVDLKTPRPSCVPA